MVAPYDIGDPARSFVRIPGSGSDPSLKSVCCDLSRGATIAASSTQQNIPQLPPSNNSTATAEKNKCLNDGKGKKKMLEVITRHLRLLQWNNMHRSHQMTVDQL